MAQHRDEVQEVLNKVARAVTAGDGKAMATLWDVPAMVIGAEMVKSITEAKEIESFFGGAKDEYTKRGIVDTRADIQELDEVGENVFVAKVRWPYLDASGKTLGAERSDDTLRRDDKGVLKIRSILMRGVEGEEH
jgi:hypothetical protein